MKQLFKIRKSSRTPVPRSERLRDTSGTQSGSASTTVVQNSGGTTITQVESHVHSNLSLLEKIARVDENFYLWLTQFIDDSDDQITSKVSAGYADTAADLLENSPAWGVMKAMFLSKTADDVARGKITFEDGIQIGAFISSLTAGSGAAVDKNGNAEFESLKVRSYMEVMELVINRLSALEGDQLFTEADTIASVEDLDDGLYGLHFQPKWEGYFTAQAVGNVLKGVINTFAEGTGVYRTSWMRVNSVDPASNYATVVLYPDGDVPAGQNFPPCELMKVARWGNQSNPDLQSCFYLSSSEGRIVHLNNVTKPIIDVSNYSSVVGGIPQALSDSLGQKVKGVSNWGDFIYARGVLAQSIIQVDYQGNMTPTFVDRGIWSKTETYYCGAMNGDVFETSDVWYAGCRWRCMSTGTKVEPSFNTTDWVMVSGNPIVSSKTYYMATSAATKSVYDGILLGRQVFRMTSDGNIRLIMSSDQWTEETIAPTTEKPYLWEKHVTLYYDGTDETTIRVIAVKGEIGASGKDGRPGAMPVPLGRWSDLEDGYSFDDGTSGSVHIVIYNSLHYACKQAHTKSSQILPTNTTYWQEATDYKFVATDLLLAERGKINNLVADDFEMYDADGNVIVKMANGEVVANKGTFKNVSIEGDVTLRQLTYSSVSVSDGEITGSCARLDPAIMGLGGITFPTLADGEVREIVGITPEVYSKMAPNFTLSCQPGDSIDMGSVTCNWLTTGSSLLFDDKTTGIYRFMGIGRATSTVWYCIMYRSYK